MTTKNRVTKEEVKQIRPNRMMNDLAEAEFNTPPQFSFIRYGRRADANYKISIDENTGEHLIEVRRGEQYETKTTKDWDQAVHHLAYLCFKFKKSSSTYEGASV